MYHGKEEIHSENRVNYLLTEVVQSNKYYKSHAVGVTFEIGLNTDRDLYVPTCLRNTSFISLRYQKSRGQATIQHNSKFNFTIRKKNISLLFCYCHHFVLKIISSKWLPSQAIQSWRLAQKFCSVSLIIVSGITEFSWQIKSLDLSIVCSLCLETESSGISKGCNYKEANLMREQTTCCNDSQHFYKISFNYKHMRFTISYHDSS